MTISIHTRLDSDTPHLPELKPLVDKEVRIIVVEEPTQRKPRDLSALDAIAGKIDVDYEAFEELRRRSIL